MNQIQKSRLFRNIEKLTFIQILELIRDFLISPMAWMDAWMPEDVHSRTAPLCSIV